MATPSVGMIEKNGTSEFRLCGRAAFPGLDVEYLPSTIGLFNEGACASIMRRLERVEYTEPVIVREGDDVSIDVPKTGIAYAWFADKGDWLLSFDKRQENALVPIAQTEWLRSIGWCISERVPSFRSSGMGHIGGGNAALVTWLRHPAVCPPVQRGVDAAKWFADYTTTTTYMYLGPERSVELFPGTDTTSGKFFSSVKVKDVPLSSGLRVTLRAGSIFIVRGQEAHSHWDMRLSPSSSTTDLHGEGYLIAFQTIAPLKVHHEAVARPPKRTRHGITMQHRVIPAHEKEAMPSVVDEDEEERKLAAQEEERRQKMVGGAKRPPVKRKSAK